jgi:DNA-binding transcriptional MocR family regulator
MATSVAYNMDVSEPSPVSWEKRLSRKRTLVDDPSIREILGVASKKGILSFAGGFPDPSLLPLHDLTRISQEVMRTSAFMSAQYGVPEGSWILREELARIAASDGRPCDAGSIVITTGGQQAIDLLAQVFLNEGDAIAVTRPCYLGALQIFSAYKPRYLEVACDHEGPVLSQVEEALRENPKFFYVVSAFDNPSGVSVSRDRAEAIVDLCERYDVPIIEDGAYKELYHDARHVSFREVEGDRLRRGGREYADFGRVMFVGTLSKVVAPGLRVGWIEAPAQVREGVTLLKQATDLHSSNMTQLIAAEFLKQHAESLWPMLRASYQLRCEAACDAIKRHMGSRVVRYTQPHGGFFIWIEVDPSINTSVMLSKAVHEYGVAYVPGAPFFASAPKYNTMRVCFSNLPIDGINEGISKIAKALSLG